jgi:hypothetical protein
MRAQARLCPFSFKRAAIFYQPWQRRRGADQAGAPA